MPEPIHEPAEPEDKKVEVVPVEQLIPGIKPASEVKPLKKVGYGTNSFGDSFISGFLSQEVSLMLNSESYEGREAEFMAENNIRQDFDVLRERMNGQIVVDLGSDTSWQGYSLASLLGAKGYVGVDLFTKGKLEGITEAKVRESLIKRFPVGGISLSQEAIEDKIKKHIKPEAIPASIVQADMLDFLRRLPDESVSIFAFGISSEIILSEKYIEEINKEVARVLSKDGGYLCLESAIHPDGVKNLFNELLDKQFDENSKKEGKRYHVSPWLISGNPGFFVKE